jgi:hypothetical protein
VEAAALKKLSAIGTSVSTRTSASIGEDVSEVGLPCGAIGTGAFS